MYLRPGYFFVGLLIYLSALSGFNGFVHQFLALEQPIFAQSEEASATEKSADAEASSEKKTDVTEGKSSDTESAQPATNNLEFMSVDQLKAKVDEVKAAKDDEENKLPETLLNNIVGYEKQWTEIQNRLKQYADEIKTLPEKIAEVKKRIQAGMEDQKLNPLDPSLTIDQLEQMKSELSIELNKLKTQQTDYKDKLKALDQLELPKKKEAIQNKLSEIEKDLADRKDTDATSVLRQQEARYERRLLKAMLSEYDQLQLLQKPRREWYQIEIERIEALELPLMKRREDQLDQALKLALDRQVQLAMARERRAASEISDEPEAVIELITTETESNTKFISMAGELDDKISDSTETRNTIKQKREQLEGKLKKDRETLTKISTGGALGELLAEQYQSLPDALEFRNKMRAHESTINEAILGKRQMNDYFNKILDTEKAVDEFWQTHLMTLEDVKDPEKVREQIIGIFVRRKEILKELEARLQSFIDAEGNLEVEERQYAESINTYREFLEEKLMWIRDKQFLDLNSLKTIPGSLVWYFQFSHWRGAVMHIYGDIQKRPLGYALYILLVILMNYAAVRLKKVSAIIESKVSGIETDRFVLTPIAILIVLIRAMSIPLFLWVLGWSLLNSSDDFNHALGSGLQRTGLLFTGFRFYSILCRKDGVADIQFRWRETTRMLIRRHLKWFQIVVVICIPLIDVTRLIPDNQHEAIARIAFVVMMAAVLLAIYFLLSPKSGIPSRHVQRHPESLLAKFSWFWFPLILLIPTALGMMSIIGYDFAAFRLQTRLDDTIWVLAGGMFIHAVFLRWFILQHQRLAFQEAMKRKREQMEEEAKRAAEQEALELAQKENEFLKSESELSEEQKQEARQEIKSEAKKKQDPETSGTQDLLSKIKSEVEVEVKGLDLASINKQTRDLIRATVTLGIAFSLYFIWADVLPALGFLDVVSMPWSKQVLNDQGLEVPEPVTLKHLILALFFSWIAYEAVKDIPGFLEITLLNKLSLDGGARYAISALTQYVIMLVGVISISDLVGVNWASLRWLVAALGVGLGFGLQEIIVNFISGLILLFERPIRVGDVVTTEGVTGIVSRIQIRATTITDWDRKEYIVPNRFFITGTLKNWTLSNSINRVVVNVGVAYGTDTEKVREMLKDVVTGHPLVMEDPGAVITFEGFGDSTLDFVVRCYLPDMSQRLEVIHQLHSRINQVFNEAGIEIAFPQQDLHIRSIDDPAAGVMKGVAGQ